MEFCRNCPLFAQLWQSVFSPADDKSTSPCLSGWCLKAEKKKSVARFVVYLFRGTRGNDGERKLICWEERFVLQMREHQQEEFVGRDCFPEAFIGRFERGGWLMQWQWVCNNTQDCLLSEAHQIPESPAVSYCWQRTKLSGVLRKKGSCDGGGGGRGIDERIKMNMQASLCASWSADLRKKKRGVSLKSCRETAAFHTQVLFSDMLSISNKINPRLLQTSLGWMHIWQVSVQTPSCLTDLCGWLELQKGITSSHNHYFFLRRYGYRLWGWGSGSFSEAYILHLIVAMGCWEKNPFFQAVFMYEKLK